MHAERVNKTYLVPILRVWNAKDVGHHSRRFSDGHSDLGDSRRIDACLAGQKVLHRPVALPLLAGMVEADFWRGSGLAAVAGGVAPLIANAEATVFV